MASIVELLGPKLVGKDGEVATETALAGKKYVALYFSAHWCPPCRDFTPKFAEWYTKDLQAKGMEVVFVSSDKDEAAFQEYFGEMPWLSLPYSDRDTKTELDKKYKVQGIPSLVILGPDGELITKDGREALSGDPTGEKMPWAPKKFSDVFADAKLVGAGGVEKKGSDLLGKTVFGLYFSAHWCPPCRGFTPKLAEWYNTSLKEKGLEVVFVSSDRDDAAFKEYAGEQPWLALDYSDRQRKEDLTKIFGVPGIPYFVIVDKDGSIITKDGRAAVQGDPTGAEFPAWGPKPVANLSKGGPGNINEVTTVIAFCETSDVDTQKQIEAAMEPIAKKFKEDAKAKGEDDPQIAFMIATANSGCVPKVRSLLKLPGLPATKHEHPLVAKGDGEGGWGCDGCGQSGEGKERYRCGESGCDFDFCGECNATAGETATMPPKLMILDIPEDGAFYDGPEGDVTNAMVQKLVDDFLAKKLERKQLGA